MRPPASNLLWRSIGIVAFASFLLLVTGFALALKPEVLAPAKPTAPSTNQPVETAPLPETNTLRVVSLGDSLTRGTGDAEGLGYVGRVRQALEKTNKQSITLTNLGINGLKSDGLVEQLQQAQVKKLLKEANLILFTIGGNDLFQSSGGLRELDRKKVEQATVKLADNYTAILREIRELNPKATVVYSSLYNPFGDTEAAIETTTPVLAWNNQANQIAARYQKVIVVPTYDLFFAKEKKYLYSDHFHPNSDGYIKMADRIIQALQ
ncbi:GDSL-type esterase/lipase family protein [Brevibacillus sp. SYSU BS000544]|uniref:GDSL-type esterase/lipase family protein n=1 Tax=Brevibacillus sp. SYSU BS000544 TaxID=3416443 RepID=UPI003CE5081E